MSGKRQLLLILFIAALTRVEVRAHQVVENALDVVIGKESIIIDTRVSMEQLIAVEGEGKNAKEKWERWAAKHEAYVLEHLKVEVDGRKCVGKPTTRPAIEAKRA